VRHQLLDVDTPLLAETPRFLLITSLMGSS
jgi:hypothetical protein